ncbi:hypothetical protein, partial [Sphingobium lactosutens]|uniref:hypothetical protein n=1 Tax=Sphingobium lactosutens TaxID=522773 RepID=UPI001D1966B5
NLFRVLLITKAPSHKLEPPENPGRFKEPGSATGGGHVHLVGDRVPDDHGLKPVPTGKAIHSGAHRQPFMAPFIMAPLLEPPSIS